jgi:hypothetical protein
LPCFASCPLWLYFVFLPQAHKNDHKVIYTEHCELSFEGNNDTYFMIFFSLEVYSEGNVRKKKEKHEEFALKKEDIIISQTLP